MYLELNNKNKYPQKRYRFHSIVRSYLMEKYMNSVLEGGAKIRICVKFLL